MYGYKNRVSEYADVAPLITLSSDHLPDRWGAQRNR